MKVIIFILCFIMYLIWQPSLDITRNGWLILWYTDIHTGERNFKFIIKLK